jgi:CRP-like cAMP-binding protein
MTKLDILVNLSYVILILSFMMRDILWLRALNVVSVLLEVVYFYLQPTTLWPVIGWNLALVVINVYWITRLTMERRPVHFSPEEQRVYDMALRSLKPRQARKLLEAGQWKELQSGEQVVAQGAPLSTLSLISKGKIKIERNGVAVDEIGKGRFIGSVTYLKDLKDFSSPVTFAAVDRSLLIFWDNQALRALIGDDVEFAIAFEASLGLELARVLDKAQDGLGFLLTHAPDLS